MDALTMPRLVRPGDRVRVVAPAGPVPPTRLDDGLAWLASLGVEVVEGTSLRRREGHGLAFLAGDDDERRHDLVTGLLDPATRAVVAARGGDGTPRLLDDMPWTQLAGVEPTIIAGLSDVTCLHQAIASRLGWATLWSPMPGTAVLGGNAPDDWSRAGLRDALGLGGPSDLVLGPGHAGDGEHLVGERLAGQVLEGVEDDAVVLRPVPTLVDPRWPYCRQWSARRASTRPPAPSP